MTPARRGRDGAARAPSFRLGFLRADDAAAMTAVAELVGREWGEYGVPTREASLRWVRAVMSEPRSVTLLARSRDDDVPRGHVALRAEDDCVGWEYATPWLSSLVVDPLWRGGGAASLLVDAVCAAAAAQGWDRIHLWTRLPGFYAARGFERVGRTIATNGVSCRVMRRALTPTAPL